MRPDSAQDGGEAYIMPEREFAHLFSPIQLGSVTVRNRVVLLPTGTGYTNRGRVEVEDVAYHTRRAEGGVGLIITGGTTANPTSQNRGRVFIEAYDPEVVPGMRRRSEEVHKHDAKIFGQLFNLGRHMPSEVIAGAPVAPSAIRSHLYPNAPLMMSEIRIKEMIEGFMSSAKHMVLGGYDGIEVHGAHGYLLGQFLSPATNYRVDQYGGDLAGRARLLIQTVRAVRAAVGDDICVGVRLSVDDEVLGGTVVDDCVATVAMLEAECDIDYLSLAVGVRGGYVKDSSVPDGVALDRIAKVKATTSLPVIASQRLRRPEEAENALKACQADLIGMARGLIADPDWAKKAQGQERGAIRLCLGDLQDCRNHLSGGLRCIVNPDVGRQSEVNSFDLYRRKTRLPRRVVIVGAGPAGLESGRRLANLGHMVTIFEASDGVGGQLNMAAQGSGRTDLLDFLAYERDELNRLGVEILRNSLIGLSEIKDLVDEVVVIASGAIGGPLPAPFVATLPSTVVTSVWDVLGHRFTCKDSRIVVVDDGSGDWPMLSSVDLLVRSGCSVTIVTPGESISRNVPVESRAGEYERLRAADVHWVCGASEVRLAMNGVTFTDEGSGEIRDLAAEVVVVETGRTPNDALWRQVENALPEAVSLFYAGDCLTPRGIGNAVSDALEIQMSLASMDKSLGVGHSHRLSDFVGSRAQ
jgi:2,4-dienoyl-CoA reductase (NADPH2)